ncbi:uncharacterized protein A4U43_C08F26920 [Asparagus officinalis]|nr:uncharacterized protein A4U43_C08F26920 [Asparagus officinalis]
MAWSAVAKSTQVLGAHDLLLCFTFFAALKATLDEEEKLAKQQEETLKAHYNKFGIIDSVMQDSSALALHVNMGSIWQWAMNGMIETYCSVLSIIPNLL